LLDCENGPFAVIEEVLTVPAPEFVNITVWDGLTVPTTCAGNTKLVVESEATGPVVPVPFSKTDRLSPSVPFTVRFPDWGPPYVGTNITLKLHELPPATPVLVPGAPSIGQSEV
jgi:hypothetical protein